MQISKKVILNNNLKIKVFGDSNNLKLSFISDSGKFLTNLHLSSKIICKSNVLFTFNNLKFNNYIKLVEYIKSIIHRLFYEKYSSFSKLYVIGLGFKNFVLSNQLYILVGDCNYIIFDVPSSLKIFCKKNQIYILSTNDEELFSFANHLKKIKKPNFYKGKGILEFKNFKFTKLKVGKKQRFM